MNTQQKQEVVRQEPGGMGLEDEEAWPHWEPALWMALSLNVLMEVLSLSSALCAACFDGKVARMV